jgi:hypothetical protein
LVEAFDTGSPDGLGLQKARPENADEPPLLCPGEARSRNRRTTKEHDELPPPHSITSSARSSSACETVSPSAFAAFRLMISSNLAGLPEIRK